MMEVHFLYHTGAVYAIATTKMTRKYVQVHLNELDCHGRWNLYFL